MFLVGDLVEISPDGRDELVAEFDRPVFPVDLFGGSVEGMVGHHLERGEVAPGSADGVEIIEPDAGLGYGERVCRRRYNPAGHERLEIRDRCDGQVDIVPPACNHRVPFHPGVAMVFKKREVCLPHAVEGMGPEDGLCR